MSQPLTRPDFPHLCRPADYAQFLQAAAAQLAASPPAPLPALAVAGMCVAIVAVSLWAQATQLQLPITFYRSRRSQVGVWRALLAVRRLPLIPEARGLCQSKSPCCYNVMTACCRAGSRPAPALPAAGHTTQAAAAATASSAGRGAGAGGRQAAPLPAAAEPFWRAQPAVCQLLGGAAAAALHVSASHMRRGERMHWQVQPCRLLLPRLITQQAVVGCAVHRGSQHSTCSAATRPGWAHPCLALPCHPAARSWLGLANPFESALGFAVLVLVVEGVTFADMTPRQISQYLSGVSVSSSTCTASARLQWWATLGSLTTAATAACAHPPQGLASGSWPDACRGCDMHMQAVLVQLAAQA